MSFTCTQHNYKVSMSDILLAAHGGAFGFACIFLSSVHVVSCLLSIFCTMFNVISASSFEYTLPESKSRAVKSIFSAEVIVDVIGIALLNLTSIQTEGAIFIVKIEKIGRITKVIKKKGPFPFERE